MIGTNLGIYEEALPQGGSLLPSRLYSAQDLALREELRRGTRAARRYKPNACAPTGPQQNLEWFCFHLA